MVDAEPSLGELTQLSSARVPMLHLCFKQQLSGIHWEPVGLFDSPSNLAFTDISQSWEGVAEFRDRTVLAVSCSQPQGLIGPTVLDNGHTIMRELAEYVDFDPGKEWGESEEIDWSLTRFHTNSDAQLSLNTVGAAHVRPMPASEKISNLYFAGDYCRHHLGMTTIEAAVVSEPARPMSSPDTTASMGSRCCVRPPIRTPSTPLGAQRWRRRSPAPGRWRRAGLGPVKKPSPTTARNRSSATS